MLYAQSVRMFPRLIVPVSSDAVATGDRNLFKTAIPKVRLVSVADLTLCLKTRYGCENFLAREIASDFFLRILPNLSAHCCVGPRLIIGTFRRVIRNFIEKSDVISVVAVSCDGVQIDDG